ncbi:fungal-specific transcription factor domain-containing protein [Ilyonectria sp. MPI-CAGE-AT-0026]|nr:fungal-specific transcription factor domain-containing protein [Ilyonectria sp. MPI-CAGE-AT-0026]
MMFLHHPPSTQQTAPRNMRRKMTMEQDDDYYRFSKRTRQACINCRRKKVRCSGDRPTCTYCARLHQKCFYENTSKAEALDPTSGLPSSFPKATACPMSSPATKSKDEVLSSSSLESRLCSLETSVQSLISLLTSERGPDNRKRGRDGSDHVLPHRGKPGPANAGDPEELSVASTRALLSAADLYFRYCHNQPYSLFHEENFRHRLASHTLPVYLRLAFLATANRFSHLGHVHRTTGALSTYADEAWALVVKHSTSATEQAEALLIAQTIHLLCVIDYSDGRCTAAWIKLGLAIRIAQCYRFNVEPDSHLDPWEREEYRRVFWSIYLLDKLISCGRERPPAIHDRDCRLCLPSNEQAFRECSETTSPTLGQLIGDAPAVTTLPAHSHFSLVILMAATLNRVVHYVLREDMQSVDAVPWSSASRYSALESTLWRLELNFRMMVPLNNVLKQTLTADGVVDPQVAGPLIYARALFHLAGCLLHHPFLLQHRLADAASRTPPEFLRKAWASSRRHATALTMLQQAQSLGCVTVSCFRGYCSMVAGSIHLLFVSDNSEEVRTASIQHYDECRSLLLELSHYWESSKRMVTKLERLYKDRRRYRQIFDYPAATGEKPKLTALWESIDNWVPSNRSPSPNLEHVEEVQATPFNPSLDFFDFSSLDVWGSTEQSSGLTFSNGVGNSNGLLPSLESEWPQVWSD